MPKKPPQPRAIGCEACPWGHNKTEKFVKPQEDVVDPNLIVLVEAPVHTEIEKGFPLAGKSGHVVRPIIQKYGGRPIIVNSANCFNAQKPNTSVINACRDAYVDPILAKYPGLPVVAMGQYAVKSLMGGNPGETSLAGEVLMANGHEVYFTYHPAYYMRKGHDPLILEHIDVMIASALSPHRDVKPDYIVNPMLTQAHKDALLKQEYWYLDVESTNAEHPAYGSELLLVGIWHEEMQKVLIWDASVFLHETWIKGYGGTIVGSNIPFDMIQIGWRGFRFTFASLWDTVLFERNKTRPPQSASLKWLVKAWFGFYGYEAAMSTWIKEHKKSLKGFPAKDMHQYLALDVFLTKEVHEKQLTMETNFTPFRLECDYEKYMVRMQLNGVYMNRNEFARMVWAEKPKYHAALRTVREVTHAKFNPDSPDQVMEELQSRGIRTRNTREDTLQEFKGEPFVDALQTFRTVSKYRGTYLKGYYNRLANRPV